MDMSSSSELLSALTVLDKESDTYLLTAAINVLIGELARAFPEQPDKDIPEDGWLRHICGNYALVES